jgi:hypothetical protein
MPIKYIPFVSHWLAICANLNKLSQESHQPKHQPPLPPVKWKLGKLVKKETLQSDTNFSFQGKKKSLFVGATISLHLMWWNSRHFHQEMLSSTTRMSKYPQVQSDLLLFPDFEVPLSRFTNCCHKHLYHMLMGCLFLSEVPSISWWDLYIPMKLVALSEASFKAVGIGGWVSRKWTLDLRLWQLELIANQPQNNLVGVD